MTYVHFFSLVTVCITAMFLIVSLSYYAGYRAGFNYAKLEFLTIDLDETVEEACQVVKFREACKETEEQLFVKEG